ncbi:cytochrome b [Pikeienuella piscinae]|uniref:Cytochrome b n=1 Tax=Pikeienuella piscinae TaxID=2748098 RepID=A0A7L5BUS7_9RHOB|nr:cytochrome b [Pikeienuella piscinae]QIE54793.1 cytochrome b [Pikeienuella piscinae]
MPRYSRVQRWLHWVIAALTLAALAAGVTLGNLGFEGMVDAVGLDATNLIFKYHKTLGILIFVAMAVRLVSRLHYGKPAYDPPLTGLERRLSAAAHGLLYAGLLVMPVLGWTATAASDFPVEFFNWRLPGLIGVDKPLGETLYALHGLVGNFLIALVALHIAAALRHAIIKRDGVLSRMI